MYQLLGAQYLNHFYIDLQSRSVQSEMLRSNPKNDPLIFDLIGNLLLLDVQGREILKLEDLLFTNCDRDEIHGWGANKASYKSTGWLVKDFAGCANLLSDSFIHHYHALSQG